MQPEHKTQRQAVYLQLWTMFAGLNLELKNVQLSLHLACSDKVTASDLCFGITGPLAVEAKNADEETYCIIPLWYHTEMKI